MAYKNKKKNKTHTKELHRGSKTRHKHEEKSRRETDFLDDIKKKMGWI